MLFSAAQQAVLLVGLAVAVTNAQQPGLSELPSCVMECVIPLAPQAGCGNTDFQCFCTHQEFVDSFKTCMPKRCPSQSDLQIILAFGNVMCQGKAGFPLTEEDLGITSSPSSSSSSTTADSHDSHTTASKAASSPTGTGESAAAGMKCGRADVLKAAVAAGAAVMAMAAVIGGAGI